MASSLLALLDDVVSVLDDVAVLSKAAVKKTSGVIGDDLALNAQQVQGFKSDEELSVIWSVAKGSFLNKLVLVPLALILSAFLPWSLNPLLMIGGAFLCFEGMEKVVEKLFHKKTNDIKPVVPREEKIKGAIRTDVILSAEIIVLALGMGQESSLLVQAVSLSLIAIFMTVFIYGVVAVIIKLDDMGLFLIQRQTLPWLGKGLVRSMPWIMRILGIVGTWAMFLVGGGIIVHGLEHLGLNPETIPSFLKISEVAAVIVGSVILVGVMGSKKLWAKIKTPVSINEEQV